MSMKNRQKTNSFAGYKYLLFVPLAFALVFMASCKRKTKVQEQVMEGTKVEVKAETGEDTAQIKNAEPSDKAYEVVEQMPTFKGGDAALMKYLSVNIKYPEAAEKAGEQGRADTRCRGGKSDKGHAQVGSWQTRRQVSARKV